MFVYVLKCLILRFFLNWVVKLSIFVFCFEKVICRSFFIVRVIDLEMDVSFKLDFLGGVFLKLRVFVLEVWELSGEISWGLGVIMLEDIVESENVK